MGIGEDSDENALSQLTEDQIADVPIDIGVNET